MSQAKNDKLRFLVLNLAVLSLIVLTFCNPVFATGFPEFSVSNEDIKAYMRERESRLRSLTEEPAACPSSNSEWIEWRDRTINRMLNPKTETNGEKVVDHVAVIAESVIAKEFIQKCTTGDIPPEIKKVLDNLTLFSKTLAVNADEKHRFGYLISDLEYLDAVRNQVELPELLKSQDFLKALSDPKSYIKAYNMIEENNKVLPEDKKWIVLLYKSRFLGTPDSSSTRGRFFVLVPEEDGYVKWIQFGILPPGEILKPGTEINNLSIVSLGPRDSNSRRNTAIVDHWRTYLPNGRVSLSTRYEKVNETENCIICHKTSPLGIRPSEEYLFNQNGNLVINNIDPGRIPNQINQLIAEYGPPYYKGWVSPEAFGPTVGPAERSRSDEFMKSCSAPLPLNDQGLKRVKDSMSCSSCHNSGFLGPINYPQVPKTNFSIGQLEEYVMEGWMPPSNNLTSPERKALVQCLMQEYHDFSTNKGLLVEWLSQGQE